MTLTGAGLAQGAADEAGVLEAGAVLAREPQADGQRVAVGEHAADRAEVRVTPAEVDNVDAVLHDRDCLETGPQATVPPPR
jgi:hypothetical protein